MVFYIAKDYSPYTGIRHCDTSDFSGEDFYHTKLNTAFKEAFEKKEKLTLVLDGSKDGYAPSFLDEALGNLVYDFGEENVRNHVEIVSERESQWPAMLYQRTYPEWEKRRIDQNPPVQTASHPAWYRLVNGKIECKVWN